MPVVVRPVASSAADAVLDLPLAIIAEDNDRIALAVTVDKAHFNNMRPALAALCDLGCYGDMPRQATGKAAGAPKRTARLLTAAAFVAWLLPSPIDWDGVWAAKAIRAPAVVSLSARQDRPVHVGDEYVPVTASMVQNVVCEGDVHRIWTDTSTGNVVFQQRVPFLGSIADGQPHEKQVEIPLPVGIGAGSYSYSARVRLICNNDPKPYVIALSHMDIDILP